MVKGNADRRRELARLRCEEQRSEADRRTAGPEYATPAEARARVLSDAKASGDEVNLMGWILMTGEEEGDCSKFFCESYFRTGSCPLKRCKHGHEVTICNCQDVPRHGGDTGSSTNPSTAPGKVKSASEPDAGNGALLAMQPMLLRACGPGGRMVYDRNVRRAVRQEPVLKFIEWNERLVFDAANPKVFAAYCERSSAAAQAGATQRTTTAVETATPAPEAQADATASVLLDAALVPEDGLPSEGLHDSIPASRDQDGTSDGPEVVVAISKMPEPDY